MAVVTASLAIPGSLAFEAMLRKGLNPWPQYCVEGYFVDFAFPDVLVAVEADEMANHVRVRP